MIASEQTQAQQVAARCTLCPACCAIQVSSSGPDCYRTEYPLEAGGGLCPRGGTIGELLGHRSRIYQPLRRSNGTAQPAGLAEAYREILDAAAGKGITFIVDPNLPIEQLSQAAALCQAWPQVKLCFALEPADRQLLLGAEASGAEYLSSRHLDECDGFLIIGDAFAANPICARGVLDRRAAQRRTPIVVIDPAAGTAAKFATHPLATTAGGELEALRAIASAVGVVSDGGDERYAPAAAALAGCKKLAVLVAAEYGRGTNWRQIGNLAGLIAGKLGGGLVLATNGANALAALRLAERCGAISLAEALSPGPQIRVALGCDVFGMLGWQGPGPAPIYAAAAALANQTTQHAQIALPTTLPGENAGRYLPPGSEELTVAAALDPPAAVPCPAEIISQLAELAGIDKPDPSPVGDPEKRLQVKVPILAARADPQQQGPVLLFARQAIHAGSGELTGHGSWQRQIQPVPVLRINPSDARQAGLKNLAAAEVMCDERSVQVRVQYWPDLPEGLVVLPEGQAEARRLCPAKIDRENDTIAAEPQAVSIRPISASN